MVKFQEFPVITWVLISKTYLLPDYSEKAYFKSQLYFKIGNLWEAGSAQSGFCNIFQFKFTLYLGHWCVITEKYKQHFKGACKRAIYTVCKWRGKKKNAYCRRWVSSDWVCYRRVKTETTSSMCKRSFSLIKHLQTGRPIFSKSTFLGMLAKMPNTCTFAVVSTTRLTIYTFYGNW